MNTVQSPFPQFFDTDGSPLNDGFVYVGEASQNPETNPITVYWDSALTQPAEQPLRTRGGYVVRSGNVSSVYLAPDDFSLTCKSSSGRLVFYAPFVTSSSTLRDDLANATDPTKGAGMEGFDFALNYAQKTIGWAVQNASGHTNILAHLPPAEWAAIFAGTSTYDILPIFNTLKASHKSIFFPAGAHFVTSGPLVMDVEGFEIVGGSNYTTIIDQTAGFAGVATVHVNGARLQAVKCMHVRGSTANGSDAIRVTDGQLLKIQDVVAKVGVAGVRLISGNAQRWSNVYAESNTTGFLVVPDSGDDTNGCHMVGLRAYNNSSWGVDIQQGAGAVGHMHSSWDVSAEANGNGIRIRGGRYCAYTLYAEANTGDEFDLDKALPNFYILRNPDGDADGALFDGSGFASGYVGKGGNLYQDLGVAPDRYMEQAFAASGSLAQVGVTMWDVTNTSGSTRGMTLSFLSYMPVGFKAMVTKRDNTPGFTLVAPGGITLTGDTGTWGVSVTTVATLLIHKINSTTAICIQR